MNYIVIICEFYPHFLFGNKEKFDKTKKSQGSNAFQNINFPL